MKKRKVTIEWLPSKKKPTAGGIYRIWFGKKYYIGRSRCLKSRRKGHENALYKRLNGLLNDAKIDPELDYYKLVIAHLKINKKIVVAKAEVLVYCDPDHLLVRNEAKFLKKAKGDPNCLNVGFEVKPYKEERKRNDYPVLELRPWMMKRIAAKKKQVVKEKKEKKQKEQKEKNAYQLLPSSEKIKYLKGLLDELDAEYNKRR